MTQATDEFPTSLYNHDYAPEKVLRLDFGCGDDYDGVELGDGTLYVKVDESTTWYGFPYIKACEILQGMRTFTDGEMKKWLKRYRNLTEEEAEKWLKRHTIIKDQ